MAKEDFHYIRYSLFDYDFAKSQNMNNEWKTYRSFLELISFEIINYDECSIFPPSSVSYWVYSLHTHIYFSPCSLSLARFFHCHTESLEISPVSVKHTNDKWFRRISAFDNNINHCSRPFETDTRRSEAFWKNNEIYSDVIETLVTITLFIPLMFSCFLIGFL